MLEDRLAGFGTVTSLGRHGLFTSDNTAHAMVMGYQAADALGHGRFDHARWSAARHGFDRHVIEV